MPDNLTYCNQYWALYDQRCLAAERGDWFAAAEIDGAIVEHREKCKECPPYEKPSASLSFVHHESTTDGHDHF